MTCCWNATICCFAVALCGCATGSAQENASGADSAQHTETVEEILASDPEREDYVREVQCIDSRYIRRQQVLDDRFIVFHMSGNEQILVQTRRKCHGLRPNGELGFTQRWVKFCVGDDVYPRFGSQLGAPCAVERFEIVTDAQVELLRGAIPAP